MKQLHLTILICFYLSVNILAQATLQGKITEASTGDDAINAYIKVFQNSVQKTLIITNFEGDYCTTIESGIYDVEISYIGMKTILIKGIEIKSNETKILNVQLESSDLMLSYITLCCYCTPIIRADDLTSGATYSSEQINHSPR